VLCVAFIFFWCMVLLLPVYYQMWTFLCIKRDIFSMIMISFFLSHAFLLSQMFDTQENRLFFFVRYKHAVPWFFSFTFFFYIPSSVIKIKKNLKHDLFDYLFENAQYLLRTRISLTSCLHKYPLRVPVVKKQDLNQHFE
jgi:hypothetical protein